MARELDVPFHGGVLVNRVFQTSPAGLADLRRGDVLFRIDGRRIKSQDMLWLEEQGNEWRRFGQRRDGFCPFN